MYAAFAARGGDLSSTAVFLLDEFGLPATSPARCDEMLERDLLSGLERRPAVLEVWDTTVDDLTAECRRMEMAITDRGGLDLAIVGIGSNGHIGMNEPGSAPDSRARVVDLHADTVAGAARYGATEAPSWGMTLGIGTLLEARTIWLLVTGAAKADILMRTIKGHESAEVPATFLRRHADVIVWADEEAAGLL